MIKYIFWDIDGTLLNFKEAEKAAIRACFKEFNLGECSDDMLKFYSSVNDSYWKMLERGEIKKEELLVKRFEDLFREYLLTCDAKEFNERYQIRLGDTAIYNDNIEPLLNRIKDSDSNIKQCAVTNGTKVAQERKLLNSGLDKILDYIFISEEVGINKPDKEFFDRVFRIIEEKEGCKVNTEEVIIIGDSLTSDIKGGMNKGIKTCFYNPNNIEYGEEYSVDYDIKNLNEVEDIIW